MATSKRRIPDSLSEDVRKALHDIWDAIDLLTLPEEVDMRGRRLVNCSEADEEDGLVTLGQLRDELAKRGVAQ